MMKNTKTANRFVTLIVMASLSTGSSWLLPQDAEAREVRGHARANVNRPANMNRGGQGNVNNRVNVNNNRNTNINKTNNYNRNTNINHNTNVNVNRHVDVHNDYHGGGYYHDHDDGIGVGGAIAIGVAGMMVGSMITAAALPPSCSSVFVNGISYQQCGSTWYQPQYSGTQVNYIVVNPPR